MIARKTTDSILDAASQFGVVSVTGPRQSGKTTLIRSLFPDHQYVNFEDLSQRRIVESDPVGFLASVSDGLIIDEVQRYPDILSYIQVSIDESFKPGKYILSGSQNLQLSDSINQSLAGRVAVLTLLPLSIDEMNDACIGFEDPEEQILHGFYPGLYDKSQSINLFYSSYIHTYVERDVRSIRNIGDLASFERFLQLLAGRIGQLVNLSQLGTEVGVSYKTIESWISVLEASYVIMKLQPFYENYGKRVVKSPKIYFTDTGLACYLLGIDSKEELSRHFARGPLFENMIVVDLYKQILQQLSSSRLYFYRDHSGGEVDIIIDTGSARIPVEIKASATYHPDFLAGIETFMRVSGQPPHSEHETISGYLIYQGKTESTIGSIFLRNWRSREMVAIG